MKRRNLGLSVVFVIAAILFVSCKTVTDKATAPFEPSGRIVIPFSYDTNGYLPVFTVTDATGTKFHLCFDSGYNYAVLFRHGAEKLDGGKGSIDEAAFKYLAKQQPVVREQTLQKKAKKLVEDGMMSITLHGLNNGNLKVDSYCFRYEPKNVTSNKTDGIVGLQFFGDCNNIIIDYVHQVLEIDGQRITKTGVPMEKIPKLDLYKTQITVNGIKQFALIDTGAKQFCARKNYNSRTQELTDEQKIDFIYNGHTGLSFPCVHPVTVKFGNLDKKEQAYNSTNIFMHISSIGRRAGYVYNLFGFSFFKDHRIQFDFKNNEFLID
jgi:hypothetical protein